MFGINSFAIVLASLVITQGGKLASGKPVTNRPKTAPRMEFSHSNQPQSQHFASYKQGVCSFNKNGFYN